MISNGKLRTKLIFFAMAVSFLALSLFFAYSLYASFDGARSERLQNLRSLSTLTAYNLEAPLAFSDEKAARKTLETLRFEESIMFAALRDNKGDKIASYLRSDAPFGWGLFSESIGATETVNFSDIRVLRSINFEGEVLGSLLIISDLSDIHGDLIASGTKGALVLFACLTVAFIIATLLQRKLLAPLVYLLSTMREIGESKDYSTRLKVHGDDEISSVMDRFNSMLSEIEKRDTALEETVATRTVDLKDALVRAEAANEAKSQFLANMSHEMRTPLNGIIGMISLLREFSLEKEASDLVKILSSSADTLLSVINDILDFSKIERGKVDIERREFQFGALIDSIENIIEFQAQDKGILFIENFDVPRDALFEGDSVRIQQVLLNLCGNALKFTSPGGAVVVGAWADRVSDKHCRLNFSVVDTGIGIPEEKISNIFSAFTQADGSTTRKYGGTGLGLAISKQLVQLMGGQIQVRSRENVGSCFSFYVALQSLGFGEGRSAVTGLSLEELSNLRVLVAEDNKVNQRLAKRLLESAEHEVVIANNGKEATELFESQEFDVILMDIQMPVMDGLEATTYIRALDGDKSQVPILGVSAHAFKEFRDKSIANGMNGYLTKPFKKQELLRSIAEILGRTPRQL